MLLAINLMEDIFLRTVQRCRVFKVVVVYQFQLAGYYGNMAWEENECAKLLSETCIQPRLNKGGLYLTHSH